MTLILSKFQSLNANLWSIYSKRFDFMVYTFIFLTSEALKKDPTFGFLTLKLGLKPTVLKVSNDEREGVDEILYTVLICFLKMHLQKLLLKRRGSWTLVSARPHPCHLQSTQVILDLLFSISIYYLN